MGSELNDDDDELKTLSNFSSSSLNNNNALLPLLQSPPNSGTTTPPIYTTASVPFRWEQQPGKPRPCTALIPFPTAAAAAAPLELQLPPRLLKLSSDSKITSPTTVLDEGPYNVPPPPQPPPQSLSVSKSVRFKSSSFGSSSDYDEISTGTNNRSGLLGDMVLIKNNRGKGKLGFFKSWPAAGKKSNNNNNHHGQKVEDDDVDLSLFKDDEIIKMRRNGRSFISHFWQHCVKASNK